MQQKVLMFASEIVKGMKHVEIVPKMKLESNRMRKILHIGLERKMDLAQALHFPLTLLLLNVILDN